MAARDAKSDIYDAQDVIVKVTRADTNNVPIPRRYQTVQTMDGRTIVQDYDYESSRPKTREEREAEQPKPGSLCKCGHRADSHGALTYSCFDCGCREFDETERRSILDTMNDPAFLAACKLAGVEPTPRQARRWRNGQGQAFKHRSYKLPTPEGRAKRARDDEEV